MQQHEINTEVNNLLQSLTKCAEKLGSTGKQQLEINILFKEKLVDLEQRLMLLEARNQITDKVTEIIDVRPY